MAAIGLAGQLVLSVSRQVILQRSPRSATYRCHSAPDEIKPYIHSGILKIYIWRACCSDSTLGSNPDNSSESASGRHCKGVTNKFLAAKRKRIKYFSAFAWLQQGREREINDTFLYQVSFTSSSQHQQNSYLRLLSLSLTSL